MTKTMFLWPGRKYVFLKFLIFFNIYRLSNKSGISEIVKFFLFRSTLNVYLFFLTAYFIFLFESGQGIIEAWYP